MIKKFFTLAPGEEFLGVIRPSLWALVPRMLVSLVLIGFPFLFWQSLMSLGFMFGGLLGISALIIGTISLRDIRRQYLENGVYVTSIRVIDVYARRRSFRVTELLWTDVKEVTAPCSGIRGFLGYGTVFLHGNEGVGYSLMVTPVWKPELVMDALPRVYSSHTV
ncbi:MAG: hypothetical protein WCT28_04690 [Patescibacteria group bacterium]|jgi:hypothetical protein